MGDPHDDIIDILDEHMLVARDDLLALTGLLDAELAELAATGVFASRAAGAEPRFPARCVTLGRTAVRLREDFGFEPAGLAFALACLERVRELEARLREFECRLPR